MNRSIRRRRAACRTAARTLAMATATAALVATLGAGHALAGPDERVLERQGRIARQADEQAKADKSSQGPSPRFPRRFFQPEPPMSSDSWLDGGQPLGPDRTPKPPPDRDGLAVALAVAGLLLALGTATTWGDPPPPSPTRADHLNGLACPPARAAWRVAVPPGDPARASRRHRVAIVGAPFDMDTTFRPGTRWAPPAVRRISALYDGYNLDMAVDLFEALDIVDVGDVLVIPPTSRRPPTRSKAGTTSPRPAPSRSSSAATTRSATPT